MTNASLARHRRVPLLALLLGIAAAGATQAAPADNPPAPPGQPSALVADTEYTTRLFGRSPAEEAIAVTRHVYTAALPPTRRAKPTTRPTAPGPSHC
jgi:hypothetical protein